MTERFPSPVAAVNAATAGAALIAPAAAADVRQSLHQLLQETLRNPASAFGYALTSITCGETWELNLEKAGTAFVLWLRAAADEARCYRQSAHCKLGYRGNPPDRLGFALLNAVCARVEAWERSLPDGASVDLFERTRRPAAPSSTRNDAPLDPALAALLSDATFSPIYADWLPVRERQLAARFERLEIDGTKNVLLVNATKGLQFYASLVDFFALLQRTHDTIRVTSASYFDGIYQFHQEVAEKGLARIAPAELMTWGAAQLNRFDVVIHIGPSQLMARMMELEGLTSKLVLWDLGFYHQLLEAFPVAFLKSEELIEDKSAQINRVTVYSCQPEAKIRFDLRGLCGLDLLDWRWFNYIPIGFRYCTYYRSDRRVFDVALLGSSGRDYSQIDSKRFRGRRFLFVGSTEHAPEIERLRTQLDLTMVCHVNEDTYARLFALCRCVVLPVFPDMKNVFLSVTDSLAAGKALVTSHYEGLARLERDHMPAVFYDNGAADLFRQVDDLLRDAGRLQDLEARGIAFAKDQLDIYHILTTMLEEQILL